MESRIKIKATVPEMREFFEKDSGVRYYEIKDKRYTQDRKSGLWYAHMRGYQHVPVSGSFSEKRRDAAEYAKMYNGLPHRVEEIERKRREAFEKEMEKA